MTEFIHLKNSVMQHYQEEEETDIQTLMQHTLIVLTIFMAIALFTFIFWE